MNKIVWMGMMAMITYLKGDIFNSPAQVLVNTVNTVGVMGKGVALEFKKRYPEMFRIYEKVCSEKALDIGKLLLYKSNDKWVLMFPTKKHWRGPSDLRYLEAGLQKFVETYAEHGITSIAFPRLGCGNGNLNWADVQPLMEHYLKKIPIPVYIYVGTYRDQVPEHIVQGPMEEWLRTNQTLVGFAALREALKRELHEGRDVVLKDGTAATVKWENNGLHIKNGTELEIGSKELCEFWNFIHDVGVVDFEKLPQQLQKHSDVLLEVLKYLDYLEPVSTSANGIDFKDGYQYVQL